MTLVYVTIGLVLFFGVIGVIFTLGDLRRFGVYSGLRKLDRINRHLVTSHLGDRARNISKSDIEEGVSDLAAFTKSYRPDWIIGIHTGGRLLSSLVASKLDIPRQRVIFAHTEAARASEFRIRDANRLTGRILFIDDITRSGGTLRALNRHVMQRVLRGEYAVSDVKYAVLVVVQMRDSRTGELVRVFDPHWAKFSSDFSYISLPWSRLTDRIKAEYDLRNRGLKFDEYYIDLHEKMVSDFALSKAIAEAAVANSEEFERHLDTKTLLEAGVRVRR